jgi:phospholipid/cholesterol/gamma-HCH transport system substrate-binding protein
MRFSERNKTVIGVSGIAVIVVVLAVALNSGAIYRSLTSHGYRAAFPEAGGLLVGDEVRIGGLTVGKVGSIDLEGDHVAVSFSVESDARLGALTSAAIKTQTPLGRKFLQVEPVGDGVLEPGSEIPLARTNSPYDIAQALSDLTTTTGQIDTGKLAESLDTVATTFSDTPPALRAALTGVRQLSQTIASRDDALRRLLAGGNSLSGVLAERSGQITTLIGDGNLLLDELYRRRDAIHVLLANTTMVVTQLRGVVNDNQAQIGPALAELEKTLDLLNSNDRNIAAAIHGVGRYARTLGEAVGSGPFFYAYIANLAPTNLAPVLPQLLQQGSR